MRRGTIPVVILIIGIIVAIGAALGLTQNQASPSPAVKAVSGPLGAGLSTITVGTEKGNFRATVLSVDLSSTRMITDTGNDSDCGNGCVTLPLADYVKRNGGFAGVI